MSCGTAIFQPAVEAGIEQQHFAFASARQTALAMSGSASFAGRADPRPRADRRRRVSRPSERPSTFDQLFAEMVIVEAGVARAGQMQDAGAHAIRAGGEGWAGRGWRVPEPLRCLADNGL